MADPFQYLASLDNFKKNSKWIMQLSGSGPPISLPHYEFFAREAFLRSSVGVMNTLPQEVKGACMSPVQGMIEYQTASRAALGINSPQAFERALQEFTDAAAAASEREEAAWQQGAAGAPTAVAFMFLFQTFSQIAVLKPALEATAKATSVRCGLAAKAISDAVKAGAPCPAYVPRSAAAPPPPAAFPAAPSPTSAFPTPGAPTAPPPPTFFAAPPPSAFPAPGPAAATDFPMGGGAAQPPPPRPFAPAAPPPAAAAPSGPGLATSGWGAAEGNLAWRNAIDYSRLAINAIRAGNVDLAKQCLQQAAANL